MGLRFRKSLKLAPGVRLNLGKRGASLSLGGKGTTLNVGKKGLTATVGLPGTGISYSERLPYRIDRKEQELNRGFHRLISPIGILLAALAVILAVILAR